MLGAMNIHVIYHAAPEDRERFRQIAFDLTHLREHIMTVSTQVQAVLTLAQQNSSLVTSVDLGMKALSQQVSDLQAQIAAIVPGNVLGPDDIAALGTAATDLQSSISTLQTDIPANTSAVGTTSAPATGQGATSSQTAPAATGAPAVAPSASADAQAASQATPLPGTGAPASGS